MTDKYLWFQVQINRKTQKGWYKIITESVQENETRKIPWSFEIQTVKLILGRRSGQVLIKKKKRTCDLVDSDIPANYATERKESEKKTNPWTLTDNKKRPIADCTLGIVFKGLEKKQEELEIRGRIKITQTTTLLNLSRILRSVLETWWDVLSLQWKTTISRGVKNLQGMKE